MVRRKTRVSFLDSGCTIERDGHTLLTGTLDETTGLYRIDGIGQTEHVNKETRALTSVFSMVTAPPKSRGRTIMKDSVRREEVSRGRLWEQGVADRMEVTTRRFEKAGMN